MKHSTLLLVLCAGCPSDSNPAVLWLAPDQGETHVKLQDSEPHSF